MRPTANIAPRGLTLFEVLLIVAILAILAALLLPGLAKPKHVPHSRCVSNLRQVALSFRQWAIDYGDFPMSVSVTNGGTKELASSGGVYAHFVAISNDLVTPKVLVCNYDVDRPMAVTFLTNFTETNISYFVGVDANESQPSTILAGDRNITNGMLLPNKILEATTNRAIGWTERIHDRKGIIALSDGSVQVTSTSQLREYIAKTGLETNRLAMPVE